MLFIESRDYRDQRNYRRLKIGGNYGRWKSAVNRYGDDSSELNRKLLSGEELDPHETKTHRGILKNAQPAGESSSLYSGTLHDFGEMARQSKDGIIHSPAHISTSRSQQYAGAWATTKSDDAGTPDAQHHMLHIKIEPHHKVCNFGGVNGRGVGHDYEDETVIPAGTKLKYSHTTDHTLPVQVSQGKVIARENFKVHHFTIHSQE